MNDFVFEWDESKYRKNFAKHKIWFDDVISIFADPNALEDVQNINGEDRFERLGMNLSLNLFVVVYCEREGNVIRIISARRATKLERRDYEESKKNI